jgi:hypothetical protein
LPRCGKATGRRSPSTSSASIYLIGEQGSRSVQGRAETVARRRSPAIREKNTRAIGGSHSRRRVRRGCCCRFVRTVTIAMRRRGRSTPSAPCDHGTIIHNAATTRYRVATTMVSLIGISKGRTRVIMSLKTKPEWRVPERIATSTKPAMSPTCSRSVLAAVNP